MSERPWPEELRKKPLHTRWTGFLPEPAPPGLQGRELAHTDLSPHNMLVTAGGLVLLDWALACPAPGWADAALAVPRLISAGHTPEQAERVARQVPAYRAADPDDLNLFARTLLNAWEAWERTRPMAHRAALTAAAREWAVHRGTNPFPE
nr:phosphotransferase [Streptomyces bauhiniae]